MVFIASIEACSDHDIRVISFILKVYGESHSDMPASTKLATAIHGAISSKMSAIRPRIDNI